MNLKFIKEADFEAIQLAVEAERATILALIQDAIDCDMSPSQTAMARSLFYRVSARSSNKC
jgi:hypothetical protein